MPTVVNQSCVEFLRGKSDIYDLIFADPPFNIDQPYTTYDDKRDPIDFKSFTLNWIWYCWQACKGVICLHGPDSMVETYLRAADMFKMTRIDWVIQHYRFGQAGKLENRKRFTNSHCHCLIFSKLPNWTFNPVEIAVDSDRVTTYNDKRTREQQDGSKKGGKRVPFTVFGIPSDGPYWGRIGGQNHEQVSISPNQLPEVYYERLIRAYSNPGDQFFDPFAGSGTGVVVATALGREATTTEICPKLCKEISERLNRGSVRIKSADC